MQTRIGVAEWHRWQRYFNEEPFGVIRDNIHAGILAATFVNASRASNGGKGKAAEFKDFLLKPRASQKDTNNALVGLFRAMAAPPSEKQKRKAEKATKRKARLVRLQPQKDKLT